MEEHKETDYYKIAGMRPAGSINSSVNEMSKWLITWINGGKYGDKEILPAIWFIDFAILPKFQGLGLGKVLTKAWMKICPNQITFCNDKSLKIFKKLCCEENNYTKRLARPINPTKWIPFLKKFIY